MLCVFLQHLVTILQDNDIQAKDVIQSAFDFLGELMKFNIEAFKIIEDILKTPETVATSIFAVVSCCATTFSCEECGIHGSCVNPFLNRLIINQR